MYTTTQAQKNIATFCTLLATFFLTLIHPASSQTELQISIDSLAGTSSEAQRMHQLFEIYDDWRYENYPESATSAGIKTAFKQLSDIKAQRNIEVGA